MPVSEDRAFTVNILGTLAQTIVDRQSIGMEAVAGFGGNAPAALVTLRFYPERPISFLAHKLRISHPGAVQLVDRLVAGGLASGHGDRRSLAPRRAHRAGRAIADAVLAQRRRVLERALSSLDDQACHALSATLSTMLEALTDDLLTSEFMCRMCDELACPDDRCPVERAEPAPTDRRGTGYGVR